MYENLFKLSLGCFFKFQAAMQKWPNENLKRFACIFALVSVLV